MKTKIQPGELVVGSIIDFRISENTNIRGKILYIDEENEDLNYCICIEVLHQAYIRNIYGVYSSKQAKYNWESFLPREVLNILKEGKGYIWVNLKLITKVYSHFDYLIENMDKELSKQEENERYTNRRYNKV